MQEKVIVNRNDYNCYSTDPNVAMRIGSEGCIHKFFSSLNYFEDLMVKGGNWRIVTPRIPDKFLEKTIEVFRNYHRLNIPFKLTVNDYGLLYRLQGLGDLSSWNIRLGRTLVRSLLYVPWNEYLLRKEEPLTRLSLSQLNMKDQGKLKLLRKLGVTGLEVSAVQGIEEQITYFLEENVEIGLHLDSVIATVGRVCPILRYYESEPDQCCSLCNKPLQVRTEKIWNSNGAMYQNKLEDTYLPDMILLENFVLTPLTKVPSFDRIKLTLIEDSRLHCL